MAYSGNDVFISLLQELADRLKVNSSNLEDFYNTVGGFDKKAVEKARAKVQEQIKMDNNLRVLYTKVTSNLQDSLKNADKSLSDVEQANQALTNLMNTGALSASRGFSQHGLKKRTNYLRHETIRLQRLRERAEKENIEIEEHLLKQAKQHTIDEIAQIRKNRKEAFERSRLQRSSTIKQIKALTPNEDERMLFNQYYVRKNARYGQINLQGSGSYKAFNQAVVEIQKRVIRELFVASKGLRIGSVSPQLSEFLRVQDALSSAPRTRQYQRAIQRSSFASRFGDAWGALGSGSFQEQEQKNKERERQKGFLALLIPQLAKLLQKNPITDLLKWAFLLLGKNHPVMAAAGLTAGVPVLSYLLSNKFLGNPLGSIFGKTGGGKSLLGTIATSPYGKNIPLVDKLRLGFVNHEKELLQLKQARVENILKYRAARTAVGNLNTAGAQAVPGSALWTQLLQQRMQTQADMAAYHNRYLAGERFKNFSRYKLLEQLANQRAGVRAGVPGIFSKVRGGIGRAGLVGAGLQALFDLPEWFQARREGKMTSAVSKTAGGIAGTIGFGALGTKIGAAIGTVVAPGIGTAIGGVLGGVLGSFAGNGAGRAFGKGIGVHLQGLSDALGQFGKALKPVGRALKVMFGHIGEFLDGVGQKIAPVLEGVGLALGALISPLTLFLKGLTALIRWIEEKFPDAFGDHSAKVNKAKATAQESLDKLNDEKSMEYQKKLGAYKWQYADKQAYIGKDANDIARQKNKVAGSKEAEEYAKKMIEQDKKNLEQSILALSGKSIGANGTYMGHAITDTWGMRDVHPVTGQRNVMHNGIDLAYSQGEKVNAFTGGEVIFKGAQKDSNGNLTGYGNYIDIKDPETGIIHRYAHGSKFADGLKKGDKIKAGQTIMYAGNTGTSGGAHLHYEQRIGQRFGESINPLGTNDGVQVATASATATEIAAATNAAAKVVRNAQTTASEMDKALMAHTSGAGASSKLSKTQNVIFSATDVTGSLGVFGITQVNNSGKMRI